MYETVTLALLIGGGIIVIGVLVSYLFDRTGLPDMLFLIILGIFLGPVFHIFDPAFIIVLSPYIAVIALLFILFDGGMKMNIYQVFSQSPRAALLASISFVFSVTVLTLFMNLVFGMPLLYGLLFGSICGGSSSVCVMSVASKIRVSEKCSAILSLESAITDILCIVISLTVLEIILTGHVEYVEISKEIATRFSTGAVLGILFALFWLSLLKRLVRAPYSYMLTVAMLLSAYSLSEFLGGSGGLSALLFGVVLGNEKDIYKILGRERVRDTVIDEGVRRFEGEIAFFIRSFFFVYLGLITTVGELSTIFFGAILSLLLFLVRYVAVLLATARSELRKERSMMSTVLTRGLATAVLSTLPLQFNLPYSDLYINLTVVIIISTAIIFTLSAVGISRRR